MSSIDSRTRQTGLYLQDQLQWGPWRAIAGLRHDRSDVEGSSMRRNQASDLEQKDSATTARLGLLYRTDSGWAPYASYATSFEPVAGVTAQGAPFKPMKGRQTEVGAKYQPSGAAWNATFAVFDLRQTNRLTDDPVNGWPEQVQTGEVRTRGLELELRGRLSRNWALIGGFTHLNTRVTRSEIPEELGRPMLFVPRNQASLWLDYTVIGAGPLSGAVLGAGARHVGASRGGDIGVAGGGYASLAVPSHTVFDLRAALQLRRLWPQLGDSELALNISNLTNRRYVNGCGSLWTCGLGLERQVSLSFVGRF